MIDLNLSVCNVLHSEGVLISQLYRVEIYTCILIALHVIDLLSAMYYEPIKR